MRIFLPISISLLLSSTCLAQVEKNYVTLESSTGTWCQACPAVANIYHVMEASGKKVALIKNHGSDSYTIPESTDRNNYYNLAWYPQAMIDGELVPYDDWDVQSVFDSMYTASMAELSPFQISLNLAKNGNDVTLSGAVTKVSPDSSSNLKFHITITESHIPELWQTETELNNVNRKMIPSASGTTLDFSSSATHNFNETFTIDPSWITSNLMIIVFVQDNDSQEIYQTNQGSLTFAGTSEETPLIASIYPNPASNQLIIQSEAMKTVELMDVSGKSILSQEANNTNELIIDLTKHNLQSGTYLIKITNSQEFSFVTKIQVL